MASLATTLLCAALARDHLPSRLSDGEIRFLRAELPGITPACWQRLHLGGLEALPREVDQCFEMTPAQHWHGLWEDYFEGQQFCPAGTRCSEDFDAPLIWIRFAKGVRPTPEHSTERSYVVEFIGRRTLRRGYHGHMGIFAHEIVVDRLISIAPARRGDRMVPVVSPSR